MTAFLTCTARIATACDGDVANVRIVPGRWARDPLGAQTQACRACREAAERLGMHVIDDRPEWLRRGIAKDLTGPVGVR